MSTIEHDSAITSAFAEEHADIIADMVAEKLKPSLKSTTPREAVKKYLKDRDFIESTEGTQRSSLKNFFVDWCEDVGGVNDMSELTGDDLAAYRTWRREESSERVDILAPKSEETQQKILRKFIERCESREIVRPNIHKYVIIPTVSREDEVRDEFLDSQLATRILNWLTQYEYAGRHHVMMLLFADTGARLGAIHSLDLTDYVSAGDGGYLKIRHRPEEGTRLKNKKEGERDVSITPGTSQVLDDYIKDRRIDQIDSYGRSPLLTTKHGRMCKSTIRNYAYAWTRPCAVGRDCPYGRDPAECDAAKRNNWAFKCPDSLSTHPVRKGYITAELKAGVPKVVLSERCDVSERILDKHYDHRTEQEKMKARRTLLEASHRSSPRYGE